MSNSKAAWHRLLIDHMQPSDHPRKRHQRRTKQTLQAPRRMERNAEQELKKLVWVTVGKTEHQAWLLEDVRGKNVVSIRWETTGAEEEVPVLAIRHEAPVDGRRSRRKRTSLQPSLKESVLSDNTGIGLPRRQKRQSIGAIITKKESTQIDSSEWGRMETGGEKVESKQLAAAVSVSSYVRSGPLAESSMKPEKQGVESEIKIAETSSIDKSSSSELGNPKGSTLPIGWPANACRSTRSISQF